MSAASSSTETQFDRGAWLALAGNALLLAAGLAVFLWRLSTPTDGWWVDAPEGQGRTVFIYVRNLVGAPSGLQPGDSLLAIEGVPLGETGSLLPAAAAWQAGRTVQYTVERQGVPVTVEVAVVHWTSRALWQIAQTNPGEAASLLGELLFLAVALLAFVKRPGNKAARALLALAAPLIASSGVTSLLPLAVPDEINLPLDIAENIAIVALFTVLAPPALLRFALVFPRPKAPVLRRPWLEYAPYAAGLLLMPAFVLTNGVAGWLWTVVSIVGAVGLLVHSARTMRDAVSQAQLQWAVGGTVAGLSMFLLSYPVVFAWVQGWVASVFEVVSGLGFLAMGASLAVAVLRYRLFDIDLIIRRTLVYTVLTAALALAYFGSVVLLQGLFRALTGGAVQSQLAVVGSTLTIAALFAPLRGRVQEFIDRRFYRRKYDAARTLAEFAAAARDETDLERLTARLVGVVDETMQPEHTSLWLRELPAAQARAGERLSGIPRVK